MTAPAATVPPAGRLRRFLLHPLPSWMLVLSVIVLIWGEPVPAGNENDYLAVLRAFWDRGFLPVDWSFATTLPDRWTFNFLFGSLAVVVPLHALAWAGRVTCWVLSVHALFRIGGRLGIARPLTALALVGWLLGGQAVVGSEFMIGSFEAKAVAYVCLLFALDAVLDGRLVPAAALTGVAVTMHPAVGLFAGTALALAVVATRGFGRELLRPLLVGLACALPGLVQTALFELRSVPATSADWEYLAKGLLEALLDLPTFGRLTLLCQAVVLGASLAWSVRRRGGFALLGWMQVVLAVPFAVGVAAHLTGDFRLLSITPFRLLPVFSLLAFFLALASAFTSWATLPAVPRGVAVLLALGTLAALAIPTARYATRFADSWTRAPDDFDAAFAWVAANEPADAVGILPPWRQDATLASERSQVVHWSMPRYDLLPEWRRRADALVGPFPPGGTGAAPALAAQAMRDHYDGLPEAELRRLAAEYGATFLVSRGRYDFPLRFQQGAVRVYDLPAGGER